MLSSAGNARKATPSMTVTLAIPRWLMTLERESMARDRPRCIFRIAERIESGILVVRLSMSLQT